MDETLGKQPSSLSVSRKYSRRLIDFQRFVASMNPVNYIFSTLFAFFQTSISAVSVIRTNDKYANSKLYQSIVYIFTGTGFTSRREEIMMTSATFLTCVFILTVFAISPLLNSKKLPSPDLIKFSAVITVYILPIFFTISLTEFSYGFHIIPFTDSPITFIVNVFGFTFIVFILSLTCVLNAPTAFDIPHIIFSRSRILGLANMFGFVAYHSLVNFSFSLELQGQIWAAVITSIWAFLCLYFLPFDNLYMNSLNTSCFMCDAYDTIYTLITKDVPIEELYIGHIVIFIIVFIYYFVLRRLCYKKNDRVRLCIAGYKVDASEYINETILHSLKQSEFWTLCRNSQKLSPETLNKINDELLLRNSFTSEHSLFKRSFLLVKQRENGELDKDKENFLAELNIRYEAMKKQFWFTAWAANFAQLPSMAADIGRIKYQRDNYNYFMDSFKKGNVNRGKKNDTHRCSVFNVFAEVAIVVVFALPVYFYHKMVQTCNKTFDIHSDFYMIRDFHSELMLSFDEIWKEDGIPRLGDHYNRTKSIWKEIKQSVSYGTNLFENRVCEESTMRNKLDEYFTLIEMYNEDPQFDYTLVRAPAVFNCLEDFFLDTSFFTVDFKNIFNDTVFVSGVCHAVLLLLYVIILVTYLKMMSKTLYRKCSQLRFITKTTIEHYINISEDTTLLSTMPLPPSQLELAALRNHIISFVLVLASILISFVIFVIQYLATHNDFTKQNVTFELFGYLDAAMLFISHELYANRTSSNDNADKDMARVDKYINILRLNKTMPQFSAIISENMYKSVASFLVGRETVGLPNINEIKTAISNMTNLETEISYLPRFMLVRLIFIIILLIVVYLLFMYVTLTEAWMGNYSVKMIDFLTDEISASTNEIWTAQSLDFKWEQIPIFCIDSLSTMLVEFATNVARKEFRINRYISNSRMSQELRSEINRAVRECREKVVKEPIRLYSSDSHGMVLIPHYNRAHKAVLKSFTLIRYDSVMMPASPTARVSQIVRLYPPLVNLEQPLPQLIPIESKEILVIVARLTNLHRFVEESPDSARVVGLMIQALLREFDEISSSDGRFMRVDVIDDLVVFVSKPSVAAVSRWGFIKSCSEFAKKLRAAVQFTADRFKVPTFASVVFARGEKEMLWAPARRCSQAAVVGPAVAAAFRGLTAFNINGIGHAGVHRPNMRIPDTSLVSCLAREGAQPVDLFLIV